MAHDTALGVDKAAVRGVRLLRNTHPANPFNPINPRSILCTLIICVYQSEICWRIIDCQLAWLVQLRQLHPLPFPSAVQSGSVRRPIGFRPPSNRIPSAAQSDSVRRPINFLHIYLVQSQYIHHNLQTLTKHIHSINTHILAFNPLKSPILVDLSQIEPKNATFLKLFCQNTCMVMIFVIPLHPLSRTN